MTIFSGGSRISRRGDADSVGGRQGLTQQLCGKLVCKNERIWVLGGESASAAPPGSANDFYVTNLIVMYFQYIVKSLIFTSVRELCTSVDIFSHHYFISVLQ